MESIAILMATYNGGKFLREQIDSVINQTNKDWQLYVRDDCSTDDTMSILKEYAASHDNIHIVDNYGKRFGPRDNFMYLLDAIDADYYMFCDQDDVWFLDKIEKSLALIKENEKRHPGKPVLIGSDCTTCDGDLRVVHESHWKFLGIQPEKFLNFNAMCVYPCITGASMILNKAARNAVKRIPEGCPPNRPMYDWWVLLNVLKSGVVDILNEPTRYYRQHANNVSGGADKLDNSIAHKLKSLRKVLHANHVRANVLKKIGFGGPAKYYFLKAKYFCKMRFGKD